MLEPGMFVRHPHEPEWGLGQVQSNIDGKVTVNFEKRGQGRHRWSPDRLDHGIPVLRGGWAAPRAAA